MTRPTSFIMQAEPKHLDADDLKAGVEHCERMILRFQASLKKFQDEQKARGIKTKESS